MPSRQPLSSVFSTAPAGGTIATMPHTLRTVVFLASVCVLFVLGYAAMSIAPPPWGLAWLPPIAVAAGALWYQLERLDARLHRRERERERHG